MSITTADIPCWELVGPNRQAIESSSGMIPHFTTEQAARDAKARDVLADDDPADSHWINAQPRQCDRPCAHVTCDGCDYALDEDEESTHFADEDSAREIAKDYEWIFTSDGRLFCSPGCHAEAPATTSAVLRRFWDNRSGRWTETAPESGLYNREIRIAAGLPPRSREWIEVNCGGIRRDLSPIPPDGCPQIYTQPIDDAHPASLFNLANEAPDPALAGDTAQEGTR